MRHCALSGSGALLALNHGAPPVGLSVVDAGTGEILRETQIEGGGTGGRIAWAPGGERALVEHD